MILRINRTVSDVLHRHSEETFPNECCGFLFGEEGDIRLINLAEEVSNAKEGDQRRRFKIDASDYRNAEKYAFENHLDLLGVYHSHPNHPAVPSEHDRKVAMPFFSYIIVSVMNGKASEIRSWRLNDQRQFEEEIIEHQYTPNK